MSRLKVGLVGCGAVARLHADHGYADLRESVEMVAVCDRRTERANEIAAPFEARRYSSYDELLADAEIEAVDLCVPHPLHAPMALQALESGRHVLVEKPIATSVADAERMVELAQKRGLTLCVSENYPFLDPFVEACHLIKSGEIGDIVSLRSHRIGYLSGIWLRDGWRQNQQRSGGGMLLDQGCHYTHILRMLGGDIDEVCAFGATTRSDWTAEDTATLILHFASGVIGQALYCWNTRTPDVGHEAYVYGERGSLDIAAWEPALVLHRPDLPGGREVIVQDADYAASFARIIEDFALAVRGVRAPTISGADGLVDLRVVEAAYRSIASGKVERVGA